MWGTYNSVVLIKLLFGPNSDPDVGFLRYQYVFINIGLNLLNLFWFRAMVMALKKRSVSTRRHCSEHADLHFATQKICQGRSGGQENRDRS